MRKILCKLKTSNLTIPKAREEAYKNALLIGGNFSELDTEINFRKADREQQNLSGFKKHNHCKTKPKKSETVQGRNELSYDFYKALITPSERLRTTSYVRRAKRNLENTTNVITPLYWGFFMTKFFYSTLIN